MATNNQSPATVSELASIGGRARAEALTPEERSEIARRAVEARWRQATPRATHAGQLAFGDILIPCAVLEDQTRVLTPRGFSVALGRYKNPKKGAIGDLPVFLSASNLKPFIDEELVRSATQIKFRMAEGGGGFAGNIALGYHAELLPQVCNVYLKAKQEGRLLKSQEHIAERCLILLNGLATVGIIALVDEATGYQRDRTHDALTKILEAFVAKELRKWMSTFKPEFYREMFRLRGIEYTEKVQGLRSIGHLTNDIVYARLAPGVRAELRNKNPVMENGHRKNKPHQWLTTDIGHPKRVQHLTTVTALMRAFDTWDEFKARLDRALPPYQKMPLFDWMQDES